MRAGVSIGQASSQSYVAGSVKCITGSLLRVTENGVIEFLGIDAGALNRGLARDRTQLLRGEVLQFAAIAAKGRARPTDDGDFSGLQH